MLHGARAVKTRSRAALSPAQQAPGRQMKSPCGAQAHADGPPPAMPLLLTAPQRTAASLVPCATSTSGRAAWAAPGPWTRPWVHQQRRQVVRRAEYDPRRAGGGSGGAGGPGPATQQQQQPWAADSYQYAPPPTAASPPPRLPPTGGGSGGGPDGDGGGGLSNLTRAFIGGAFILGAPACSCLLAVLLAPWRGCRREGRQRRSVRCCQRSRTSTGARMPSPDRLCHLPQSPCRHGRGHLVQQRGHV